MSRRYTCYLSGPITGLGYSGATSWRHTVQALLDPHIKGLNPMRGKEYLENADSLKLKYDEHVMSTSKGIYGRDLWDTMRCDVMLVNLSGDKPATAWSNGSTTAIWPKSVGTIIEIGWFTTRRNPLVLCGDPGHPILRHPLCSERATYICSDLGEAVACVNSLFADE